MYTKILNRYSACIYADDIGKLFDMTADEESVIQDLNKSIKSTWLAETHNCFRR